MKSYNKITRLLIAIVVIALPLLSSSYLSANSNSLMDQQVSEYLSKKKGEQVLLLKQLVNINSGTLNIDGVINVGKLLEPEFQAAGFSTHWVDLPAYMQRAGTLVAERKGSSGKKLLLIGHLDTVFPKDSPFQKFTRTGKFATGPGVIDNKGGIVVILYALKALQSINALKNTDITIVLTGDEENNGKPVTISRQHLISMAKSADIVLDFEPTVSGSASVGRRGTTHWLIEASGHEGHSSIIFSDQVGAGATFELARILDELRRTMNDEQGLTINPSTVVAGVKASYDKDTGIGNVFGRTNLIAKTAIARGDIRYISEKQRHRLITKMTKITQKSLPGTKTNLQLEQVLPPMPTTQDSLNLFESYSIISKRLGYGEIALLPAELRGGGDISYVAPYVSTALVGIGASGEGEHSPLEKVDIDSLFIRSQLAALLILELTGP
ncbi:peptidase, M20/M25/M40 family [Pseudomonas synxantha]|uniref:Peptidase, M20/M25/M40 family n=1 Tax=Pseudomonas synxantha TaxID=47883 RepID=A0A3G7U5H9_9PSED|nr:M20/M25/M40 family metallo-hydrolase [Pseudomonas synxantha]AZE54550.1 peptidase, M20/M25/M40 family [Pseudomonas synxantha]